MQGGLSAKPEAVGIVSRTHQFVLTYARERLTPIPWLMIPAFLFAMASGQSPIERPLLFAWLFLAVTFFRVLDDLLCWDHDKALGKPSAYLQSGKASLLALVSLVAKGFATFSLLALPIAAVVQLATFSLLTIPIYLLLRRRPVVVYVSLLKYPALLFVVATETGTDLATWPLLTCAFFATREVLEESFGKRCRAIELLVGTVLVTLKITLSSL